MDERQTNDTPTLGEVARLIANHDRRFHEQIERMLDAMGVPKGQTAKTIDIWQK